MKRIIPCFVVLALVGCSKPIVKNPAFSTVKTMAIVSIYTNHDIYNVKEGESSASLLTKLKKAVGGEAGLEDAHVQVATQALLNYQSELGKLTNWGIVAASDVMEMEAYKSFVAEASEGGALFRAATANQVTPPGMALVTFKSVVGEPNTRVLGDDPTKKVKARLQQLCGELGVDGVAVVMVDVAYETGAFSGMSGTGLLSGIRGKATPSISSAMVVITKDGSVALQTKHVTRGGGKRHSAGKAPMLLKGKVDLTGEKGAKSIEMIGAAMKLNAAALKEQIVEEAAGG